MKVAFDENVPIAMVRLFKALAKERRIRKLGLTIESAQDYTPAPEDPDFLKKSDVPWIKRFSRAGGKVIISGNIGMLSVPHERLALLEENMIVMFFERRWNNWQFFAKCSLLLLWLPEIARKAKSAKPKTFWRIPSIWDEKGKLRPQPTGDPRLEKSERKHVARARARKQAEQTIKKAVKRIQNEQPDFHDIMATGLHDGNKTSQINQEAKAAPEDEGGDARG